MAPMIEFSRRVRIEPWPETGIAIDLRAEPQERTALARRFDLVALDALRGHGRLERTDEGEFQFHGWLEAEVVQSCVVSLEDVPARLRVPVERRYRRPRPDDAPREVAAVIGWDDEAEPLHGAQIDLGEMLAEELGLALDPYPRAPDAAMLVDQLLGPNISFGSVEPDRPFAALRQLEDKHAR